MVRQTDCTRQDERCGMLIPRPQYPLYSAALTMVGGRIVYYDMFEEIHVCP